MPKMVKKITMRLINMDANHANNGQKPYAPFNIKNTLKLQCQKYMKITTFLANELHNLKIHNLKTVKVQCSNKCYTYELLKNPPPKIKKISGMHRHDVMSLGPTDGD